ncbi:unnamed protein product (macronuclear) [Paramecium tetraurelia]|uniref:RING-type domain-containing protein n=1 Tax=Paramecium tetraurelia TaxID=5888 RepID=A0EBU0_PARTE|nr:uncharacterized protein GSPATT00025492001 [Paramecium tetraurelia]CAK92757.1 unnamed protein product [Paramecium tetraurelia]|eukprot:XP_001460154.1 hypothetical protein (macronuclear) [Paramecium tetraurelia strain d4-2]
MQQSQISNNEEQQKLEQQTEKDECEICLQEIQNKGIFKKCNHYFCINCVLNWTLHKKSCPKCRCKVSTIIKLSIRKYPRSKKQSISKQLIYLSNSESESSDSDYIPIDTLAGRYGPKDFL